MSFTDADQELWDNDPHEYIRVKFDVFEDYATPVPAAQTLLNACCKKRKDILPQALNVIMEVIVSKNADDKQKDGALHMVGILANILEKKKSYFEQVERMLITYVFPEFNNPVGHIRARVCWVTYYFCNISFSNQQILPEVMRLTINALLNDKELPVKVEAAISLQVFLNAYPDIAQYIVGDIKEITKELLTLIRETENEDITNILQKFVLVFTTELIPVAIEICQHLASTFSKVLESEDGCEDKAITAMGLLNAIETLINVMDEHPDVIVNIHPIVINVVLHIFQQNLTEFYEETFSLVYELTAKLITPEMWRMFEIIYQIFQKEGGSSYFIELMPTLHNYVTVDTAAFLSNPNRLLAIYNMCETMMSCNAGEDVECHAAKLLEVIILQCKGLIDSVIPMFVQLALSRLTREVQSSELRTMCLQVVIAAVYYNPELLLRILDEMPKPENESIFAHFVKQWIHDTDCFLGIHDRKICVLGLCALISLKENRPDVMEDVAERLIPSILLLFDGLRRAYESRAQEEEEEDDDGEGEDEDLDEALSSDDDNVNNFSSNYFESIADMTTLKAAEAGVKVTAEIKQDENSDDEEEESLCDLNETQLEAFPTNIDDREDPLVDEYITFKEVMTTIGERDPDWYYSITVDLSPEHKASLEAVLTYAGHHERALESKRIEKQGGFAFPQQNIPTSFKFG